MHFIKNKRERQRVREGEGEMGVVERGRGRLKEKRLLFQSGSIQTRWGKMVTTLSLVDSVNVNLYLEGIPHCVENL